MTNFNEKCNMLGKLGEDFVYKELIERYPQNDFLILNLHSLCEMDFAIVNKADGKILRVYEVKTTTKSEREFGAGSFFQLQAFRLQKIEKEMNLDFVPYFLYVLRVDKEFWRSGGFKVISKELYSLDSADVDLDNCKWKVK